MGNLSWRFDHREIDYIKEVLESGFASGTSGNFNSRLEKAFAERHDQKFAITFNSGTTTLHAALEAFGVGYGDEVLVSPLTVISCMNAILYCNAIPVFVDVDPDTFIIDPDDIRNKITSKTKAIMVVNLYGQVANMTEIMKIADENDLYVLEDCAQCYLGKHKGQLGGTFGHVGSWSFENSKHLTTGDGGIVTCDNEQLADKMRRLSTQGFKNATAVSGKVRVTKELFQNPSYKRHSEFGYMFRMPEVAAAMGLAQLEKIDWFVGLRIKMANFYKEVIEENDCDWLVQQKVPDGDINSYYTFAAKLIRDDINWLDFRKKYYEFSGDGIYAAWALLYREDSIGDIRKRLSKLGLNDRFNTAEGICPNAEFIQPQLMQFPTNVHENEEMEHYAEALSKTIKYFL